MIHTTPPVHLRLGVATGTHLRHLRNTEDPLPTLHARLQEAELRAHLAWEAANILRSRFARIPEKHRPYFTPAARFRILEIKNLLAWNAGDTAQFFLVCTNTIFNWEAAAKPETRTVGSPLAQKPPVRRAADVVRALVQLMTSLGLGGPDLVARVLARAGWRLSARSALSPRHRPFRPPHLDDGHLTGEAVPRPHLADGHRLRRLLQGPPRPPGVRPDPRRPRHGPSPPCRGTRLRQAQVPHHRQGGPVRRGCLPQGRATPRRPAPLCRNRQHPRHRLYGLHLPLTREDLERRLELALLYYLCFRPHEGLRGATPAEAFQAPFEIDYLDPAKRRFPLLRRVA